MVGKWRSTRKKRKWSKKKQLENDKPPYDYKVDNRAYSKNFSTTPEQDQKLNEIFNSVFPTSKVKDWNYIIDGIPFKTNVMNLVKSYLRGETSKENLISYLKNHSLAEYERYGMRFR